MTIRSRAAEWDDAFSQQAMEITLTAANVGAYCEALHTEFLRRELLAGIQERADALLAGHDPLGEATELLTLTERIAEGSYDAGVVSAREAAAELLEDLDRVDEGYRAFVETGISDLDRILGGGLIREDCISWPPGLAAEKPRWPQRWRNGCWKGEANPFYQPGDVKESSSWPAGWRRMWGVPRRPRSCGENCRRRSGKPWGKAS